MIQRPSSETDLLGRKWYRIDVLKGEELYDRITITAGSDMEAKAIAHEEAVKLTATGKKRTLRLYPDDRSRLIAEIEST